MRDLASLAALARRQAGVFTREQALAAGYPANVIANRVRNRTWRHYYPRFPRVLTASTTPAWAASHAWAALLVVGDPAAIALDSAAALWGWCDAPAVVCVVTERSRRPRPPDGVRVLRTLADRDHVVRRHGLLVTDRARTMADCLRFLPRSTAQEVLDRSQFRHGPTLAQVARLIPARGSGTAQARDLLRAADGTASAGERRLVSLLRRSGIRGWQVNARLTIRGRTYVVDVLFPDHHLVIEVDGFAYHSSPADFERDRQRQNSLVNAGFTVLRFTYRQLVDHPDAVLADIAEALGN